MRTIAASLTGWLLVVGGSRDDEVLVDFLPTDASSRSEATAVLREDDRVLVRRETPGGPGTEGAARVILAELDPVHGLVIRNVWAGTSRAYWSGRAPTWTRMR